MPSLVQMTPRATQPVYAKSKAREYAEGVAALVATALGAGALVGLALATAVLVYRAITGAV